MLNQVLFFFTLGFVWIAKLELKYTHFLCWELNRVFEYRITITSFNSNYVVWMDYNFIIVVVKESRERESNEKSTIRT